MTEQKAERVEHADPRRVPSLGKIVKYTDGDEEFAAMITHVVKSNVAHITIFDPHTGPRSLLNITGTGSEKPGQGQWSWM